MTTDRCAIRDPSGSATSHGTAKSTQNSDPIKKMVPKTCFRALLRTREISDHFLPSFLTVSAKSASSFADQVSVRLISSRFNVFATMTSPTKTNSHRRDLS
eukprot:c8783_g1_i2.p1 GENE.c8783_g1_i2~~c8783_g1_i2.p1  ORF type:complete len:101 (-),score=11.34 c8783_g1_i2:473-775(-)